MNPVIRKLHEAQLRKDLPEFRPGEDPEPGPAPEPPAASSPTPHKPRVSDSADTWDTAIPDPSKKPS